MAKVKVYVFKRAGSPNYQLKWTDPKTKAEIRRSAGTTVKREADRAAAKIEQRFADGTYSEPQFTTWKEFRYRYESEYLAGLALTTQEKAIGIFKTIETLLNPRLLTELDSAAISKYIKKLRQRPRRPNAAELTAESTIKSHLAHLKSALNWAKDIAALLEDVPTFPKVVRAKKLSSKTPMKGRPITAEEYERMLGAAHKVVGDKKAEGWKHLIKGLYLSGLRLGEALQLRWSGEDCFRVDLSGRYPMFVVVDVTEKGHQDRILPMATEFAEFLKETPIKQRYGSVFKPVRIKTQERFVSEQMTLDAASRVIARIGKKAGVKVTANKWASAHDLRRAFGNRWANLVMPHVLQQMMRHDSIDTTMRFYVGKNADSVAETIHNASLGNIPGNNKHPDTKSPKPKKSQTEN